jgi:hypothetical protein
MIRNDEVNWKYQFDEQTYALSPEMTLGLEQWAPSWPAGCRGSLLAYFLRWQGTAVLPMIEHAAAAVSSANGSDEMLLESVARGYYSDSFNDFLERRLNGADRQAAASAAWLFLVVTGARRRRRFFNRS